MTMLLLQKCVTFQVALIHSDDINCVEHVLGSEIKNRTPFKFVSGSVTTLLDLFGYRHNNKEYLSKLSSNG